MKKNSNVVGKRRFLFLLFLIFTTQISLNAYSQERKITFSLKNASLKEIISEIRKNSDYDFVYRDVNLESFARQDVAFKDATVGQILTDCLKGTNLGYEINGKTIIIRKKAVSQEEKKSKTITGKVSDEQGNVLPGVTVIIKGTTLGTATGADGEYKLEIPGDSEQVLIFSFVGMKTQEIAVGFEDATRREVSRRFGNIGRRGCNWYFHEIQGKLHGGCYGRFCQRVEDVQRSKSVSHVA